MVQEDHDEENGAVTPGRPSPGYSHALVLAGKSGTRQVLVGVLDPCESAADPPRLERWARQVRCHFRC